VSRERWRRLLAAFALPESNESFDRLVDACSRQHLHCHTVAHIDHCPHEFEAALTAGIAALPGDPDAGLMA
jgi:predicted metal-dependent HD superfamily phosphohydrolase